VFEELIDESRVEAARARISLAEEVGRVAAQLMGWPGTRANQDSILHVPPGAGTTGHHQDDSYQAWHLPGDVVTCWIALEDTSADGSTLEYVRGSHRWPLGPRIERFTAPANYRKELDAEAARLGAAVEIVPVLVRAGGASFHHGRMWHGANYNRTKRARSTVSVHCMSSASTFHPTVPSPMFNHYKHYGDVRMDESFFPILWTRDGRRSRFLAEYLDEPVREPRRVAYAPCDGSVAADRVG
jgi:ectoine hydroxylase-related dioxygenase (phytanoyl-CoA dioxygenase family)